MNGPCGFSPFTTCALPPSGNTLPLAADGHVGFTSTRWHTADELLTEIRAAGLDDVAVYGVEGPAWPALDVVSENDFTPRLHAALRCAPTR